MDIQQNKLSSLEKAAILLVALGKEGATHIFKNLRPEEVERLTVVISTLKYVPPEATESVMEEFHQMLLAQQYISEGGQDYARELLEAAMGTEKAEEIITNLTGLNTLKDVDPAQVLDFIRNEHPQTIALILAHLDRDQAAEVLSGLPEEKQHDIVQRIATMDKISPEIIRGVEETLEFQFESSLRRNMSSPGGPRAAAEILNLTDGRTEKGVMSKLQKTDRDLAAKIKDMMFVFEDILTLDNMAIQKVLQHVPDVKNISYALVAATDEIKQFILENISERARNAIKEEMEYLGPVRLREVQQAQRTIIDAVQELAERGEIVIGKKDEIVIPGGRSR